MTEPLAYLATAEYDRIRNAQNQNLRWIISEADQAGILKSQELIVSLIILFTSFKPGWKPTAA
jgi:hypothetical protein